jgi:hypothetical protein
MLSYFIIGATIIIPFIGLILLARTLGTDYKYRDLDAEDKPLVIRGQGDYRKVIRPSGVVTPKRRCWWCRHRGLLLYVLWLGVVVPLLTTVGGLCAMWLAVLLLRE